MKKTDTSKIAFYIIIAILLVSGIASILYRHYVDHQPWFPGEKARIWSIEGQVDFKALPDRPLTVRLNLPQDQDGYQVLDQSTASSGFGLSYVSGSGGEPVAEWTRREAEGNQVLHYKVNILEQKTFSVEENHVAPPVPEVVWRASDRTAARALADQVYALSADYSSFARELSSIFARSGQVDQNLQLLRSVYSDTELFTKLLNYKGIPAHPVNGLFLEDGRRNQRLVQFLKVYLEDGSVQYYDMRSFKLGLPEDFIIWNDTSGSSLDVFGGSDSGVRFAMVQQVMPLGGILDSFKEDLSILSFSIYDLPLAEQSIFKTMLLIPLGVLIVVMLRVLVGVRTSGTFMPVLLAMSFMETTLITGLLGFLLVVGTGLVIRSYLSRLNLLLVARISAVIISVICIITVFTVSSYKLGLTEGLKITYFPIIILSWTIERMSILWEEEGSKEVVIQGGSSLLVAVVVFLFMNSNFLRYFVFNFLGAQLIFMAVTLLLGSYTGYRLSELRRFSPLVEEQS
ncbi:MAG: inactive transglutaminase family protein [Spirochaetales bacterium]|nr:inactive transglutaminase family protein [Spirochaetales bacterium]